MKIRNILTSLILITAVLTGTVKAFGYAKVGQQLRTDAQPAVAIEKVSSNDSGTINAETGIHGGLNASFTLQTNGDDSSYNYILTATTPTTNGTTSAFTKTSGRTAIVFVNVDNEPTMSAIEDARAGGSNNANVITYPIDMSITSPMTAEYMPAHATYGACWIVRVNNANEGTLIQTIGGTPIGRTYTLGDDAAGTYRATITFTAIAK